MLLEAGSNSLAAQASAMPGSDIAGRSDYLSAATAPRAPSAARHVAQDQELTKALPGQVLVVAAPGAAAGRTAP